MAEETTAIVIMGATGDLAQRKLVPALFNLWHKSNLPQDLQIVGYARSDYSDDQFREYMWRAVQEVGGLRTSRQDWDMFAKSLFYVRGDLSSSEQMEQLKERLEQAEGGFQRANRLFYLSIPPTLYEAAVKNLGVSRLAQEDTGWRRVVIEKPFGTDLKSAQALNRVVWEIFDERQVFRIDHYLGKETVQNLFVLRFANTIFEPLWNLKHVDNIQITVAEKVALEDRAGYYEQVGVVRDMVQNHLLQLLALVAMEPPDATDAESLRHKKVQVLKDIRHWTPEQVSKHAVRGQYQGYRHEKSVAANSNTATYAALRLYVDNERWRGVPFYLRTGKAMAERVAEIIIQFKLPPEVISSLGSCQDLTSNILGICLQPDEGVHLGFEVKMPGQDMCMWPVSMRFHYRSAFGELEIPEAYEQLLHDALTGDTRLFIRSDQIEEAWRIVDPLVHVWEIPPDSPFGNEGRDIPLHIYEPGSWGPEQADQLLAQDGREWLRVCGMHQNGDT